MVPDSFGSAMFCGAVANELRVTGVVCVPKICKLPLLRMVNFVAPLLLVVKRSPVPELSTSNAVKLVAPEIEATDIVAELPLTSSVDKSPEETLTPTRPVPFGISAKLLLFCVLIISAPVPVKLIPAAFPVSVIPVVPASVRLPVDVRTLALEKKLMLPVVPLPSCKVWLLVVPSIPVAVRDVAPVVPEIEAVGVPPATLVKANFAEAVDVPPSRKSCVVILSVIALLV